MYHKAGVLENPVLGPSPRLKSIALYRTEYENTILKPVGTLFWPPLVGLVPAIKDTNVSNNGPSQRGPKGKALK